MLNIDTSDFKAKASKLQNSIRAAYYTLGVGSTGSPHRTLEEIKANPHVNLG